MPRRLITISYTGLDAGGGVPAFNRALHAAFPERDRRHFCWTDFPWAGLVDARGETEWGRARTLNDYLLKSREITTDDVVVADGFWATGLEHLPLAISHSHGIWSHLTHDDVLAGKPPDMPDHHAAQVAFRRRWVNCGRRLTAVSAFIAEQLRLQWGLVADVINNGVDTDVYRPRRARSIFTRCPLVIHGVNDRSNANKGWDHIERIKLDMPQADVVSLDEAFERYRLYGDRPWTKPQVLAEADVVVHPSGYEGNSMFVAEALACGVPVVGYDVGYLWSVRDSLWTVLDRGSRSPEYTSYGVQVVVDTLNWFPETKVPSRQLAVRDLSIDAFRASWRRYVESMETRHAA